MKILLDAGADVTVRNKLQMTALHLAAQSGSADKVALLLASKADPAAVDARNFTALDHAMARTTGDKTKLIEILKPVSPVSKPTGADAGATTEKKSQ
jgi:ankyrin repeat protein